MKIALELDLFMHLFANQKAFVQFVELFKNCLEEVEELPVVVDDEVIFIARKS